MTNPTIAAKIIALKDADLALRDKLIQEGQLSNGYNTKMEALHIINAQALDHIIDQIGYPTTDKVGKEANEAAWLVIQHAISRPIFMKKCLRLLEDAVDNENANPINLAYLSDRIAVFENKPQRYGTQFDWDANGALSPNPYDDLRKVNQRRNAIGLNTLEEQISIMRERVKMENETPSIDFEQRQKEMNEWKKSVGWI